VGLRFWPYGGEGLGLTPAVPRVPTHLVSVIIWSAMCGSMAIYLAVAHFVRLEFAHAPVRLIAQILAAVALGEIGLQFWLRSRLADEILFPKILDESSFLFRSPQTSGLKRLSCADRGEQVIPAVRNSYNVILWALAGSIALYGLVLTLLSNDLRYVYGFSAVAFADMLVHFPKRAVVEDQVARWRRWFSMWGSLGPARRPV
jgi:hypothetical protein